MTTAIQRLVAEWDNASEAGLSKKQKIVLSLIAQDFTLRQISEMLHISKYTVEDHAKAIRKAFEVHTMAGAVSKAYKMGILKTER